MVHFHLSTPYLFIKRCSFNVFCLFHSSEEQSNNDYFIYDCNLVTNHILHYFFLGDDWGRAITSQSLQAASLLDRNYIISRISTFNSVSEHDYLLLFTFLFFFDSITPIYENALANSYCVLHTTIPLVPDHIVQHRVGGCMSVPSTKQTKFKKLNIHDSYPWYSPLQCTLFSCLY